MKLGIYSLEKTLFEGDAEKIIARTPMGEITVLDKHLPLISTLIGPSVDVIDPVRSKTPLASADAPMAHRTSNGVDKNEKRDTIFLSSGIIEVRPESEVIILANSPQT